MKILIVLLFVLNSITSVHSARDNGGDFNNKTITYRDLIDFYKGNANTNNDKIKNNYRKITNWTLKNLREDISSRHLYQALNQITVKGVTGKTLDKEHYKDISDWSLRNFKKINNFPKIKTTWKWANKKAKNNWKKRFKFKDAARIAKVFFKKDSPEYPGNLIGRATRGWKKVMKSDFMTTDLKDFTFILKQFEKVSDDFVKVSEIFEEEVENIQDARANANSNTEKAAVTVLRSIWLVTKEGAYLFVALPVKLTYRSTAVTTSLVWKGLSRGIVFLTMSAGVALSPVANIIAPTAIMMAPILDIVILRAGGNGAIYTAATVTTAGLVMAQVGSYAGVGLATTTGYISLSGAIVGEQLGRKIIFPLVMGVGYTGVSIFTGLKAIHRYIGVPIASGFAYLGYSTFVGLTEGVKKTSIATATAMGAIVLTIWKGVEALGKLPRALAGNRRFKYFFNEKHSIDLERDIISKLRELVPVGSPAKENGFYLNDFIDGTNRVKLFKRIAGQDIEYGKLKLTSEYDQPVFYIDFNVYKIRKENQYRTGRSELLSEAKQLYELFNQI